MLGSQFLDDGSTDSERVYSRGNYDSRASFPLVQPIRHFCSLTTEPVPILENRRVGVRKGDPAVKEVLQNQILICSETANASSFKI